MIALDLDLYLEQKLVRVSVGLASWRRDFDLRGSLVDRVIHSSSARHYEAGGDDDSISMIDDEGASFPVVVCGGCVAGCPPHRCRAACVPAQRHGSAGALHASWRSLLRSARPSSE